MPTRFCLQGYMQIAVYHGERKIARQACWYPKGRKSLCEHETFYSLAGFRPRLPSLEKQRALTTHVPICAKSESYKTPSSRHRNRGRQFYTLRSSIQQQECLSATNCNNVSRSHNPPRDSLTQATLLGNDCRCLPTTISSRSLALEVSEWVIHHLAGFACKPSQLPAGSLRTMSGASNTGGGDPGAMRLREFHCVEFGIDDGKDRSPIRAWRTVNAMDGPKFGSEEAAEWRSSIVSNRKCLSSTPKHGVS